MQLSVSNKELGLEIVRLRRESRDVSNQLQRRTRAAVQPIKSAVVAAALEDGLHKAAAAISIGQNPPGVQVNTRIAPYARPLDHPNTGGFNRHPVFGHDVWVEQPARKFFERGIDRGTPAASTEVARVLDDIAQAL